MNKLFEAKKNIPVIKKDAENPFFKSGYASLSNIIEVIEPILTAQGLYIVSGMTGNSLTTKIVDSETNETLEFSKFDFPQINDMQKIGSAITYARRYNLVALLNLNIEDDDDGNATKPKADTKQKVETITPECKTAMATIESCKDLGSLKIVYDQIKDSEKLTATDKSFLNNLIKEKKGKLK